MKLRFIWSLVLLVAAAYIHGQTLSYSKILHSDSSHFSTRLLELADGSLISIGYASDSGFAQFTCDKLDAGGNLLWSKVYGGGVYDIAVVAALSPAGEIYIAGDTRSYGAGMRDMFLTKLDTAGNVLWTKVMGGPGEDGARAICVAANGDVILSGAQFGLGMLSNNIVFFRFDPSGNRLVRKMIGDSYNNTIYRVQEYSPEKFILLGQTAAGGTNMDFLVMMMDGGGNLLWAKTYDGGTWDRYLGGLYVAQDDKITLGFRPGGTGFFDPTTMAFIQIDSLGNFGFARHYPQISSGFSVFKTDTGFVLIGNADSYTGATRGFFIAVNDSGVPQRTWLAMQGNRSTISQISPSQSGGYVLHGGLAIDDTLRLSQWVARLDSSLALCEDSIVSTPSVDYPMTVSTPAFSILDTGLLVSVNLSQFQVFRTDTFLCYSCPTPLVSFGWTAQNLEVVWSNSSSGGITGYHWDFGDGDSSSSAAPNHTYAAPGTYIVCLTATNACGSETYCDTVTVACPLPNAGFSILINNLTATFTNASGGAVGYLWDFGDGNTDTTANPSHTYAGYGSYAVCLYATNACGTDTLCQVADVLVAAPEPFAKHVLLYPNPCGDQVHLRAARAMNGVRILVTDLMGQIHLAHDWDNGTQEVLLDLSKLAAGCWLVRMKGEDWTQTMRLVKH